MLSPLLSRGDEASGVNRRGERVMVAAKGFSCPRGVGKSKSALGQVSTRQNQHSVHASTSAR